MPKITIREIDNTGSDTSSYVVEHTVLVPAINTEGNYLNGLYTSKDQFKDKINEYLNDADTTTTSEDKKNQVADDSIAYILTILNQGLPVQYFGAYDSLTATQTWTESDVTDLYEDFKDRGLYDLLFITTGVIENDLVSNAAIDCAASRGDAVAILSTLESYIPTEMTSNNKKLAEAVDNAINTNLTSAKNTVSRDGVSFTETETAGSYAAIFTPKFTSSYIKGYDGNTIYEDVDKKILKPFPASLNYLVCFAKSLRKNAPEWFAISGTDRGASPLTPIELAEEYGDAAVAIYQTRGLKAENEANHISTNVICNIRPYGNIIWGNRTMNPLGTGKSNGVYQLTASDFLNIRLLACSLKKTLYRAARKRTFEPNSDILWFNFKSDVEPLLENMKNNQGIRGYKIVKLATNKKALLSARITISPIEAVEDFDFTVEFADSIDVE